MQTYNFSEKLPAWSIVIILIVLIGVASALVTLFLCVRRKQTQKSSTDGDPYSAIGALDNTQPNLSPDSPPPSAFKTSILIDSSLTAKSVSFDESTHVGNDYLTYATEKLSTLTANDNICRKTKQDPQSDRGFYSDERDSRKKQL